MHAISITSCPHMIVSTHIISYHIIISHVITVYVTLQVSMRSELTLHHCVLPIGDFAYLGTFTHESGVTYSIKVRTVSGQF